MKQAGPLPLKKRFYVLLALAVVAVLGSALTVRHMTNKLTRGLTQFATRQTVTEARQIVQDAPDPRDTEQFTMPPLTTKPTSAAPTTTKPETTTAAATEPTSVAAAAAPQRETFRLPLNGTKAVKDYSPTVPVKNATMGDWRVHGGIDFAAKEGDKVYAVGDGTVKKVTSDEAWGYVIEVDHGAFLARYCAVQQDGAVPIGKTLRKGDVIGVVAVPPAEQADGCHLHFEVLRAGALCDPMELLGMTE